MRELRLPGEGTSDFRERVERTAIIARVLRDACLANHDVRSLIEDPGDPHTEAEFRRSPVVRIDYEEAVAIATIGEGLYCTRSKHWGAGPQILPLEPDDPVSGRFVLYVYKEGSRYNKRFKQRKRLKELLGKPYRTLVKQAQLFSLAIFLRELTAEHAYAIRRLLQMEPSQFWRLARGRELVELPEQPGTLDESLLAGLEGKPKQLGLSFETRKT